MQKKIVAVVGNIFCKISKYTHWPVEFYVTQTHTYTRAHTTHTVCGNDKYRASKREEITVKSLGNHRGLTEYIVYIIYTK